MNIWQVQFAISNKDGESKVEVDHVAGGDFISAFNWAKGEIVTFRKQKHPKGTKVEIISIQKTVANCAVIMPKAASKKGKKNKR